MDIKHRSRSRRIASAAGAVAAVAASLAIAGPADAAVGATVSNGTLTILGNGASDDIALRLALGDPNILQLDVGDDGVADQSFDRSLFTRIVVRAGGGDDHIRIDQVNGAFADEQMTLDGGSGNDTIEGGNGDELMLGGSGNDSLDGNRGNDTAFLGSGNDSFRWDPGDGSDVVEGQSGVDVMDFNGANIAEKFDVSANGARVRFFRDIANITMDLDDVERIDLDALGGVDQLTVNDLSGTDMRRVSANLAAADGSGDLAADTVIVNGTDGGDSMRVSAPSDRVQVDGLAAQVRITHSEAALDKLQVNGLLGDDEIAVRQGVNPRIGVSVELGL